METVPVERLDATRRAGLVDAVLAGRLLTVAVLVTTAGAAWADHGAGDLRKPADPLMTGILWGATAFLVAIIVVLIVMVFTRRTSGPESDE